MTDYAAQIELIGRAQSLDEIRNIARTFSAQANGSGGVLYSGWVKDVRAEAIALELAEKLQEPIINNTPRGQFLADQKVSEAIKNAAELIFQKQGLTPELAEQAKANFLFGDAKAPQASPTSLKNSLWGEASSEFAGSLRGDVKVVASAAAHDRVFAQVEIPEVLNNPKVTSLAGQPVAELKTLYAQGGADAMLPKVQAPFVEAAPKGIFVAPENPTGSAVSKVSISREAAETLGANVTKFRTAAELAEAGLARAPTGFAPALTPAAPSAIAGEVAGATKGGLRPGMMMKGAAVVGAAALAYDFVSTGHQVMQLEAQGNTAGSESAKTHFIGRNVGGIGGGIAVGFLAGAGYGAAGGSPTGPGALVTAGVGGVIGGVGGAFLGEKWAQEKDIERVFTQTDKDGNEWSRDPNNSNAKWTRVAEAQQIKATTVVGADNSNATFGKVRYVAGDVLANELNYKSANASYELGLANIVTPQNPYALPLGKDDVRGKFGGGEWERDAETKSWTRPVIDQIGFRGTPITHTETASPERAGELDQAAKLVIAQNAANTPAAIAARYQVAYNQFGWNQHGDMPPAVKEASTRTESLLASDGDTYTRGANGSWTTPGMVYGTNAANGNITDELNTMHASQRAGLQQYSVLAAEALANPTLPSPASMRDMVANVYRSAGVERNEVQIDAATAALKDTHAREGLDKSGKPYSLNLQPDAATGRAGPNSGIVTMMDDGQEGVFSSSKMVPKAITSAEEIKQAEKSLLEGQRKTSSIDTNQTQSAVLGDQTNGRMSEGKNETPTNKSTSLGHPSSNNHPFHSMFNQATAHVQKEDEKQGRQHDEKSERLALAATALAANEGMHKIDHMVFSKEDKERGVKAGENVIVVQGGLLDPAHQRPHMKTEVAINTPVDSSVKELEMIHQRQTQEAQGLAQTPRGPTMT
jgi:hypothetical protein